MQVWIGTSGYSYLDWVGDFYPTGTRPEGIKLCPVIRHMRITGSPIDVKVCATAQHRAMLDQVLETFDVRPDYDLDVMAPDQTLSALTALSPLDGRYRNKLARLAEQFSEYGLIRYRVRVELAWLQALADERGVAEVPPFSASVAAQLAAACKDFSLADAERVKAIEQKTNHDVKALEYWLKERFAAIPEVARAAEFIGTNWTRLFLVAS